MRRRFLAAATVLGLGLSPFGAAISEAQTPPTADLAIVSSTSSVRHAKVGETVTFTIVATNNGPDQAELFVQTAQQLDGLKFESVTCEGVSSDGTFCEYGFLQPGATRTADVQAQVQAGTRFATETACVTSPGPINDPNPGNDCASAVVRIHGRHHSHTP
jgi:uncharacterized repeat protein (TIGR01451 family)